MPEDVLEYEVEEILNATKLEERLNKLAPSMPMIVAITQEEGKYTLVFAH